MEDSQYSLNQCEAEGESVDSAHGGEAVVTNQSSNPSSVVIDQCANQSADKPAPTSEGLAIPSSEAEQPAENDGDDDDSSSVAINQSSRRKETRRRRSKWLGGLQLEKTGIWTLR